MTTTTTQDDPTMRRTYLYVFGVGLVLAAAASAGLGIGYGIDVVFGAVIAVANLWVLSRSVRHLLAEGGGGAPWALVAVAKFFVLLAGTYALIEWHLVEPLGLAIGFGALPFGILLAGAFSGRDSASLAEGSLRDDGLNEERDHA